ncbi:hypothetical protein KKF91_17625, partial [Myxococcota bacterium]|nr:hypothetical protein [Myxococcota bacterium]
MRLSLPLISVMALAVGCSVELNEDECQPGSGATQCSRVYPGTTCSLEGWCVFPELDMGLQPAPDAAIEQDAATVEQDAATVEQDAATVEQDAALIEQDAATVEQD